MKQVVGREKGRNRLPADLTGSSAAAHCAPTNSLDTAKNGSSRTRFCSLKEAVEWARSIANVGRQMWQWPASTHQLRGHP